MGDFYDWIQTGVREGFCSEPKCNTHDGLPLTDEEDELWEDGHDPCLPAVRLYYPEAA